VVFPEPVKQNGPRRGHATRSNVNVVVALPVIGMRWLARSSRRSSAPPTTTSLVVSKRQRRVVTSDQGPMLDAPHLDRDTLRLQRAGVQAQ